MEMKPEESGENYIMRNYILLALVILRVYKSRSSNWKNKKYKQNIECNILTYTLKQKSD